MKSIIHKQTTGLKRDTTDKYYTCIEVVELCMKSIQAYVQPTIRYMY